jgi:DNA-directed RNA polymerase specialized sigma24 family protein
MRRRIRRLTQRLLSPKFEFVMRYLDPADQAERSRLGLPCWPPRRRQVALHAVVLGRSLRGTAAALGVTMHAVRREMQAINALFEARPDR